MVIRQTSTTTVEGVAPSGKLNIDKVFESDGWYAEDYEGLLKVTVEETFIMQPTQKQYLEVDRL